ncbi:MAG: PH domain-containing protein [Rikenellaceae bacterium]
MIAFKEYKFTTDRRTYFWSAVYIVMLSLAVVILSLLHGSSYLMAWVISIFIAIYLLMWISAPRRMVVDRRRIMIYSVLDAVNISIDDVLYVRKASPRRLRWLMPIYGACGFLGYYGYFFNVKSLEIVKLYATEWHHFVEIVDVHERRHYISCRQRDEFISQVERAMLDSLNGQQA